MRWVIAQNDFGPCTLDGPYTLEIGIKKPNKMRVASLIEAIERWIGKRNLGRGVS
jgi:hypothetical protein